MEGMTRRKSNHTLPQLNITNLVDVALTLVVILLIISPFIEQGIDVKLPSSSPSEIRVEKSLVITVAQNGVYYVESRNVTLGEMSGILREKKAQQEGLSVIIKGDGNVPYKDIVKALDTAKKCGIEKIGLATQAE